MLPVRPLFLVLSLFAAGLSRLSGDDVPRGQEIVFCGEELSLAYVEVMPDGSVLNEYIRPGESVETWQILVALRHHPDAFVDEIVLRWRKYLAQLPSSGLVLKAYEKNSRTEQRFTLTLHDASDAFIELGAMRFVPDSSGHGVSYYQAAVRLRDLKSPRALEEALQQQAAFVAALPSLTIEPVRTQPGAPEPADSTSAAK